jgi:DNA-binding transcriptional MerR regulator
VDELERLQQIRNWLEEGLTVSDCRQLLLTGQLTRALDLGLGAAPEPRIRPKAPKPRVAKAPSKAGLARVASALKKLVAQLNGTPPD